MFNKLTILFCVTSPNCFTKLINRYFHLKHLSVSSPALLELWRMGTSMVAHLSILHTPHTFVGCACVCDVFHHLLIHLLSLLSSLSPLPPRRIIIMDDNNNKRKRNAEPTPEDFVLIGKDIQNKSGRSIGSAAEEERAFREFFGTTAPVVTALWKLLAEHTLIPEEGTTKHLLWTLHFFRAYPKQAVASSTVGGSGGAIDPKTLREPHLAVDRSNRFSYSRCGEFLVPSYLTILTSKLTFNLPIV